ncbi:MAG: hypothetical protein K2N51_13525 [Lachnospiraceae bacterium]|nr:hypothetical protein [Lachnospiraceae bacterium]
MPSKIEEKYWKNVLPNHQIKTKLSILNEKSKEISTDDKKNKENMDIQYIIRSSVVWHDPLACELCYPEYVIDEIPLVETDATSTVPTQQIRYREYQYNGDNTIATATEYDRFTKLQGCVFYDHICRRQNHYQFYIDTQRYFYNVKNMVKNWLVEQSKEFLYETNEPVLHIIFSPEHNTNVGFVQYVNIYCFNGLAEIVSINVDKQFRSNFICEHAAIKRMIEELHRDRYDMKNLPVKFYFVDDTVITGDTLEKANGLLHSLVPSSEYPVNLFSKIFVLVDRLSDETKQSYVDSPDKNFMAFLHIDVSNIRTHGDSCIGCKLEQDAEKLYKRSATRNMATYWFGKFKDYRKKPYDNKNEMLSIESSKSYRMLLFSHVLQNVVVKQGNCYTLGDVYDIVLNLSLWLLKVDDYEDKAAYGYKKYLEDMRNMDGVCTLLKTICRPFFSYDFKIKRQVYTFFIFLAELILGEKSSCIFPKNLEIKENIGYLLDNDRISKMDVLAKYIEKRITEEKKSELDFLKDYLLEGLTDMGSTYAMRMQTLKKVYKYFKSKEKNLSTNEKKEFWNSYEVNIHRLVTGNADESRELWLEYMYITGMEYRKFSIKNYNNDSYEPNFFYETIADTSLENQQDKYFYQFCHNLFMQNIGINFDGLEEKCIVQPSSESMDESFLKDYWKQMRKLDSFDNPLLNSREKEVNTQGEERLFILLKSGTNEVIEPSVNEWYERFLKYIVDVIVEKYNIDKKNINIAMLTENNENVEHINRIQFFDIVQDIVNSGKTGISETRYYIKERVVDALESGGLFDLENNGYTISEGNVLNGEKRPYVIAFFDNPGKGKQERSLARVFLYISIADDIETNKKELTLRLILRDVLMYRNRILRFLERDFAGEIYANYAHTIGERNILSHEKAHSHNTTADDAISLEIFQGEKIFGKESDYAILKKTTAAEWLLLRNYTNGQIAKIFNRSFHDHTEDVYSLNSPMLYIPNDSINYSNSLFKQKLDVFSRLNLKNENRGVSDDRFKLLNQIIYIQYDKTLNDALFIQGNNGQFYNLEYFKCILIDIMFSAIKFESDRPDYLLRIDRFLEIKDKLEKDVQSWDINDEATAGLIERLRDSQCSIKIFRDISLDSDIDYLVIQNPVKEMDNSMGNWEEQNEIIKHRLNNPLDYADGHMSLLAIKRYIENLDETMELECSFQYVVHKEDNGHEKLYFENRLPILKREVGRYETIILDR